MAKILWIDDYAGKGNNREMGFDAIIYFVEQRGHQVNIVSSRNATEEVLEDISIYDLMILDIIMDPLLSSSRVNNHYGGLDILENIANSKIRIPIVIFSVMSPKDIKIEARRRGLDLTSVGVKEIFRKGSLTPTFLALKVEKYLYKKDH